MKLLAKTIKFIAFIYFSKRVFQENKARQIFRKTIISYSLIRTRIFRKICSALFSWNNGFEIRLFALLPMNELHKFLAFAY